MTDDAARRPELELSLVNRANQHDATTVYRWRALPGVGNILALVMRDERHEIRRFPRVQDVASSCRLVKCGKEAAGTRDGTAGQQMGQADLTWAFSEAAGLLLRNHEPGQKYLARLEKTHDKGKAVTLLAPTRARTVYDRLKRETVVEMHNVLQGERSSAGEPAASLDTHGISLERTRDLPSWAAPQHAQACIGPFSRSPRL